MDLKPIGLASALACAFCAWPGAFAAAQELAPDKAGPLKTEAWSPGGFKALSSSEAAEEKSLEGLKTGKGINFFKKLKSSWLTLEFKEPREIGILAVVQDKPRNWSQVKELELSIDGKAGVKLKLDPCEGELAKKEFFVQGFHLDRKASKLEFKVSEVYKGDMPWGGFSVCEASYGPSTASFLDAPLGREPKGLSLKIASPEAVEASLLFKVCDLEWRIDGLKLSQGEKDYAVLFKDALPAKNYGFAFDPLYLEKLGVVSQGGRVPVKLLSALPIPAQASPDLSWKRLPPVKAPKRTIKGEEWTGGASFNGAGRFGNSIYNGILTELVGGSWFKTYTAGPSEIHRRHSFDISAPGFGLNEDGREAMPWALNVAGKGDAKETVEAGWALMDRRIPLSDGGTLSLKTGILAPGFLIDCDRPVLISSRGGGALPVRSGAPDEDESRFLDAQKPEKGKTPKIGPAMVLCSRGALKGPGKLEKGDEPWLVAIWGFEKNSPTFWGDLATAVLFTSDADGLSWDASGVKLPAGRCGVSSAFHGLLGDGWRPELLAERAKLLAKALRKYPVECQEWFRCEGEAVRLFNEFKYLAWGDPAWQAPDYAPLPPLFSWAKDSVGWNGVPSGSGESIVTPFGPYRWVPGSSVELSLPACELGRRAFPRLASYEDSYRQMENAVLQESREEPLRPDTLHPWKLAYFKRWSACMLGASYLEGDAKKELFAIGRDCVERMYDTRCWLPRKELFSGIPYYSKGWWDVKGPIAMFGDPNSNSGQAAYSLNLYANYSGDWALVERLWPRVSDSLRIFEVLNDWAAPQTTSREAVKFSCIDMDTIGYAGLAGAEEMAGKLGRKEDFERIRYLRAKVSAATALRFNFNRYLDPSGARPEIYVTGFAEDGPVIEKAKAGNGVGLDHIAMCLAWTGEMPELYSLYLQILGPDFLYGFQKNFMDVRFPDWREMNFNKSRIAAHVACRAYLPQWSQKDLDADYQSLLKAFKQDFPPPETGGMFGAYSGRQAGVCLVDWGRSGLSFLRYDQKEKRLDAGLKSETPFELKLRSSSPPKSLRVDGCAAKVEVLSDDGVERRIKAPPCKGSLSIFF